MKVTLQASIEAEAGQAPIVERIACLERAGLDPSTLGLTLSEAQGLLVRVQAVMVTQQVAAYVEPQRICLETRFSVISVQRRFRKTKATDTLKSMHMCFSQRKLRNRCRKLETSICAAFRLANVPFAHTASVS